MPTDVEAAKYHQGFTVGAVEFERDLLPRVRRFQFEDAPILADAGLGVITTEVVKALVGHRRIVLNGNSTAQSWGRSTAFESLSSKPTVPAGRKEPVFWKLPVRRCRSRSP